MSQKRFASTGAFVLVTIALLCVQVGLASGDEAGGSSPGPDERVELPSKRTATSDTFEFENGERETRFYEGPVNYKDAEGRWKPIEEGLEATGSGEITNRENPVQVDLPEQLGAGPVRVSAGDYWVASKLLGPDSAPGEVSGSVAAYEGTDPAATFELSSLAKGVKEEIEISSASAPSTFSFALSSSANLTPHLVQDGSVRFQDAGGHLVALLPAPVISDSSDRPDAISNAAFYELAAEGAQWLLTLRVSQEWLSDPGRRFPVLIDPTVTLVEGASDCSLFSLSSLEKTHFCAAGGYGKLDALAWDYSSGAQELSRSLLSFKVGAAISSTAEVTSAKLGLYAAAAAEGTKGILALKPEQPWSGSYASWRYSGYPGCAACEPWKIPGGGASEASDGVASLTTVERGGSGAGWWTIAIPGQLVQHWARNPAGNTGILIQQMGEKETGCPASCAHRTLEFESSAAPNAGLRPYLSVTYIPPASEDSKITSPTDGTKTAKRFLLTAAWEHTGVEGVTFQYKTAEGWKNIPESQVTSESGQAVKWPVGVELKDRQSKPLYWDASGLTGTGVAKTAMRAVLSGQVGAGGYTQPVKGEINKETGGPKDATAAVGPGSVDLLTGNFAVTRNDVSIPSYGGSLEFSRSLSSREPGAELKGVLGPGWKPGAPVETAGGSSWRAVKLESLTETWEEEGESFSNTYRWAALSKLEGLELDFEEPVSGTFLTPPEASGFVLARVGEHELALTDPSGDRTRFSNSGTGNNEYIPISVATTGGAGNKTSYIYEFPEAGKKRLHRLVAPAAEGIPCQPETAITTPGCHVLDFNYGQTSGFTRLLSITYYDPGNGGPWTVAQYGYNAEGRLTEEWDPRVSPSLKETYSYETGGQLHTLTPPGQEPWTMEYATAKGEAGRLADVKRASLVESAPTAQTTIRYGVPLSGSGAPYSMAPEAVAAWGQTDVPTDATAIYPPDEIPHELEPTYTRATIYYMDAEGQNSNLATPSGAGTSAPSITTNETDRFGNVVRELTAQNRLRALAAGSGSVAKSRELDRQLFYSADGTQLQEEIGPAHLVSLKDTGETREARAYRSIQYNDPAPPAGEPGYHLPTTETTGALVGGTTVRDQRATTYEYNWALRKRTATIVDPEGLDIKSVTLYDPTSGQAVETRQPSNPSGGGAGTRKILYFSPSGSGGCASSVYAGLPCKVEPGAQPGTAGQPQLLSKKFLSYNQLGEPTEISESPNGGSEDIRRTTFTYDAAGRQTSKQTEGGGQAIPKVETLYSSSNGMPTKERFACPNGGECSGESVYGYQSSFGTLGSGNGQLSGPRGIASDGKGHVWVVDRGNNRVEEFGESGEYLGQFGSFGTGNGQFNGPWGIAVTPAGNLWVADTGNQRLEEFNAKGEFIQKFGTKATAGSQGTELLEPEAVAIAPGGMLWVSDDSGNRVAEFRETVSAEGERFVRDAAHSVTEPTGVAVDGWGDLWVSEGAGNHLLEFDSEGTFIRSVGSTGSGDGQFSHPSGVGIDTAAGVYVVDRGNNRVEVFNAKGEFLTKFGTTGSGSGNFSEPNGIAFGAAGAIFVADKGNNRVDEWLQKTAFDSQATTMTYDALGRPVSYEDADGNKAETGYDLLGRPVTSKDAKGTQTVRYDSVSGLPVELEDSAAGRFTATYDADGNLATRTLPDSLTAETTYNSVDEPMGLTYTKSSFCGTSCTWLNFGLERTISGQIVSESGTLGTDRYGYDKAGRLTSAQETPPGGSCTTRVYTYDANSNRTSLTTRAPELGGACAGSGGAIKSYSYDAADRLIISGITYDSFGRITSLPGEYTGGKTLTTSYFSNDMVATQSQNGVSNTFTLDASLRQRSRLQAGGLEGTEVFHYDDATDSPAWTERGSSWTRIILGIEGETLAIQENGLEPTLRLTNLHGDVVATAAIDPSEPKLLSAFGYDEFGNPTMGSSGRFGWLGGWQRRTELNSGVIQMGTRSYVPAIGRFISVDSVSNGSANAYDYADQDPINNTDLGGENTSGGQSGPCVGVITLATDYIRPQPHHSESGHLRLHYWVQCNASAAIVVSVLKVTQYLQNTTTGWIDSGSSHAPNRFHGTRKWGTGSRPIMFGCLYHNAYKYKYEFVYQWNSIAGAVVDGKGNGPLTGDGGTFEMAATAICGEEWT